MSLKKIHSHIYHLYQLAKIDNSIVKEEKNYLYSLGRKNGVTEDEVNEIIGKPADHFHVPETIEEKVVFLHEYILMMLVDNKLDEREAQMCGIIAEQMGLDKRIVGSMTSSIVAAKEENKEASLSDQELSLYVSNPGDLF